MVLAKESDKICEYDEGHGYGTNSNGMFLICAI